MARTRWTNKRIGALVITGVLIAGAGAVVLLSGDGETDSAVSSFFARNRDTRIFFRGIDPETIDGVTIELPGAGEQRLVRRDGRWGLENRHGWIPLRGDREVGLFAAPDGTPEIVRNLTATRDEATAGASDVRTTAFTVNFRSGDRQVETIFIGGMDDDTDPPRTMIRGRGDSWYMLVPGNLTDNFHGSTDAAWTQAQPFPEVVFADLRAITVQDAAGVRTWQLARTQAPDAADWVLAADGQEQAAAPQRVAVILRALEAMTAVERLPEPPAETPAEYRIGLRAGEQPELWLNIGPALADEPALRPAWREDGSWAGLILHPLALLREGQELAAASQS